jgi:RimJ/RimL family protein N-acetyltransferase
VSIELTDGVVVLHPRTMADAEAQLRGQDEEMVRWLAWEAPTRANVTARIEEAVRGFREGLRRYDLGIYEASSGVLIGNCLANYLDPLLDAGEVNIAYAVFPSWRRRGIASRTVKLLCAWLAQDPAAKAAILKIDPENEASRRVAEGLGFVRSGSFTTEQGILERYVRLT